MTPATKEVELKLQVPRECLQDLHDHPNFREFLKTPLREETLVSTYFDSDNFDLRHHGISLRVRKVGDHNIQTVKITDPHDGRYFERSELEREIAGDLPDLGFAADSPLRPVLTEEVCGSIKPIFETRVQRTAYHVGGRDSDIEMSFDDGQIIAGNSTLPLLEIELELKRGTAADLFKFAQAITAAVPAQLTMQSKAERGYELIGQRSSAASTAGVVALAPDLTTADAFKTIAHACLHHMVANQTAVMARDAKALHQMRIAMRRLRAAISVFSGIVRDDQVDAIKTQLRGFARELAHARDLDVLITEVLRPFRKQHPKEQGFVSLSRTFGRERTKAYKHAAEVVGSDAFRKFVVACAAWIEAGPWTAVEDAQTVKRRELPVTLHAAEQISRRRKKCRKLRRSIDKLDAVQLHRLRIRIKKLRYATEFFESLYTDHKLAKRCQKFVSETRRLQDALGALNDVTTRRALFADMMTGKHHSGSQGRAFAAGLIVGHQESQTGRLLKDAGKALAKLEKVKPFWKSPAARSSKPDHDGAAVTPSSATISKVA